MIPNEAVLLPFPCPVLTTRSGRSLFDLRLSLCSRGSRVFSASLMPPASSRPAPRATRPAGPPGAGTRPPPPPPPRPPRGPPAPRSPPAPAPRPRRPAQLGRHPEPHVPLLRVHHERRGAEAAQPRGRHARVGPRRRPPAGEGGQAGPPAPRAG